LGYPASLTLSDPDLPTLFHEHLCGVHYGIIQPLIRIQTIFDDLEIKCRVTLQRVG
jgi:hypothetical protein